VSTHDHCLLFARSARRAASPLRGFAAAHARRCMSRVTHVPVPVILAIALSLLAPRAHAASELDADRALLLAAAAAPRVRIVVASIARYPWGQRGD